tara:strand:+ start:236 stop:1189 length:954 start_codon:yes stop_codon:yes gene_type:complete
MPSVTLHTPDHDADGIAQAQAVAGAGNLTLDGALVTNGVAPIGPTGVAQLVRLTSVGNDSGIHFILTGKDADGSTQTENLAGANAGTVDSTFYWTEISNIAASAAAAGNVSAGVLRTLASVTRTLVPNYQHFDVLGVQVASERGQQVTITSAGDDSAITFTVNGVRRGRAISEDVTGANTTLANTVTNLFDEVTTINTTGNAGTVTAGGVSDADGIATSHDPAASADLTFGNSAFTTTSNELAVMPVSLTYSVDYTMDGIGEAESPRWVALTGMDGIVATGQATKAGSILVPVQGIRLRFSAYASGSAYISLLQRSR